LEHVAGEARDPELEPLEVGRRPDLAPEPTAHLGAGVAGGDRRHVEPAQELVGELRAATFEEPGALLPRVQAEGDVREHGEGRVLANVVVAGRMDRLDRAVRHGVEGLERSDDLAGREGLDLEAVVRGLGDVAGQRLGGAVERVERLRKGGGQAPADFGRGLGDRRHGDGARGRADAGRLQELTTLHGRSPSGPVRSAGFWRPLQPIAGRTATGAPFPPPFSGGGEKLAPPLTAPAPP
jgi:hypothetical protein